jgi:hypothetical protein
VLLPFAQGIDCSSTPRAVEAGREPCLAYHANRAPFFGDTHSHTTYSFDAVLADTRSGPREAYAYAAGGPLPMPPYDAQGQSLRSTQLQRPLDFAIVTDHSEFFGEPLVCLDPTSAGYANLPCLLFRSSIGLPPGPTIPIGFVFIAAPLIDAVPVRNSLICGPTGADCRQRSESVWLDIQAAAEEAYDRTSACSFTSFVGYEWTANTAQRNLHRNVIFRSEVVPAEPTSYFEAQTPQQLWAGLQSTCIDALPGCDAVAIPHNPNLAGGVMFETADGTAEGNALRARWEPLVEIMQHKGESECRTGVGTNDESCGFEKLPFTALGQARDPNAVHPPLNFVRNALLEGLVEEGESGVNPFRMGFVGGTDTHSASPGGVEEDNYAGHLGFAESRPDYRLATFNVIPGGVDGNPGGLAVLWAEENARDALFRAMKRREAYATSGTRPVVRFFAGYELPPDMCQAADYADAGYRGGVPMGGVLPRCTSCTPSPPNSPRFSVLAMQDPGSPGSPGTPLQRVQIVKGWTDATGAPQEAVYDVAGDAGNGASVDTGTCTPQGAGAASLCAVWQDPDFDPDERAFYYARVLENPTCRWSQWECVRAGITCDGTTPSTVGFEACCNPSVPKTVQERAWTSPIWYAPGS